MKGDIIMANSSINKTRKLCETAIMLALVRKMKIPPVLTKSKKRFGP